MTILNAYMSIFEVQSKENIENLQTLEKAIKFVGGRKDRLFLPERQESDDAGKRGFESI